MSIRAPAGLENGSPRRGDTGGFHGFSDVFPGKWPKPVPYGNIRVRRGPADNREVGEIVGPFQAS